MSLLTDSFYHLAKEYCIFVNETEITPQTIPNLIELLMKLYMTAMQLPDLETETIDSADCIKNKPILIRFAKQITPMYWDVFDPVADEEPICGDLYDDLSGIAFDLQRGLGEYDSGRIGNAVFEWKLGFNSHWGNHVVSAIKVLHFIMIQ